MLKLFLSFTLLMSIYEPYTVSTFRKNFSLYDQYLSSRKELDTLGRLHLLFLRFQINQRLGNQSLQYIDSCEIDELINGDEFLINEWQTKY